MDERDEKTAVALMFVDLVKRVVAVYRPPHELLLEEVEGIPMKKKKIRKEKHDIINVSELRGKDFVPDTEPAAVEVVNPYEIKLTPTEVRNEIIKLKDNIEHSYLRMGELIYHVQKKKLYEIWAYGTIAEYFEKELKIGKQKGWYLGQIWKNTAERHGRDILKYFDELGWTKMTQIQRVLTKENALQWTEKAKHLTCIELAKEVRAELKKQIPDDPSQMDNKAIEGTVVEEQTKTVSITFPVVEYQSWGEAYKFLHNLYPELGKGAIIGLLAADFMGSNQSEENQAEAETYALKMVSKFAYLHGWSVVVQKQTTKDILMGVEELKAMLSDLTGETTEATNAAADNGNGHDQSAQSITEEEIKDETEKIITETESSSLEVLEP